MRQAERKSMNKSLVFYSASHDMRSSLAAIDSLIDTSSSQVSSTSVYVELCSLAEEALGILNFVLDFSKIEVGKVTLAENEFDFGKVLEDAVILFYPSGIAKGIDVVLDPCDGSVLRYSLVKGDNGKLK
ncbi:hypothetical protein GIB67_039208 [Kingdonia uniflora]|uniref:histidine kinase n=1 Tax=Kingdonia uniflora TaxID=39325 RepID=A0A7J7MM24_9MAGN|nr:hypothetical protein GIB67_039208 [Kingdonia uniflora]